MTHFVLYNRHGLQGHFNSGALWGKKSKTKAHLVQPRPLADLQLYGQKMRAGEPASLNSPLCPYSADTVLEAINVPESLALCWGTCSKASASGQREKPWRGAEGASEDTGGVYVA